ncbi:hypothetical protein EZ449_16780 [Pedobacter frigidisoli]|uniref:Uncharacterized protein n=1 Tax=Pedobacter frigidisoli TaxID=2530455 RepID=A0A4V2MM48_9SPHI|nr:hypothetical protein [Pedobacter frigidisoli]TCD04604.1 hypothetical protein EZ449_16780 [Pedobacter frigidisoli]
MEIEKLTDQELFNIINGDISLDGSTSNVIKKEFMKRDFSIEKLDELGINYEVLKRARNNIGLTVKEKIVIILFPFMPPIQAILANKQLLKNNKSGWAQHWDYVLVGFSFWTITVILIARFFLFNKS